MKKTSSNQGRRDAERWGGWAIESLHGPKAMMLLKSLTSGREAGLQRAEERTTRDEVDERGQGLPNHAKALAGAVAEGLKILAVQALRTGVWIPEPT